MPRFRHFGGERGDLPRCGRCIVLLGREPPGLHDIGESDALTDRGQERRRIMLGERLGGFAGEDRASGTAVQDEPRLEFRSIDPRFAEQRQHLGRRPAVER